MPPPITVLPDREETALNDKVLATVAKNMGVPPNAVPPDVKAVVKDQIKQTLNDRARDLTRELVAREVKGKLTQQVNTLAILDDRLKGAQVGIKHVAENAEVKQIMDHNARLLKMKFDSLVAVGFNQDQAFQIVLHELAKPRR
jgi:hypothetical protein